jgi:hypothetical protein
MSPEFRVYEVVIRFKVVADGSQKVPPVVPMSPLEMMAKGLFPDMTRTNPTLTISSAGDLS